MGRLARGLALLAACVLALAAPAARAQAPIPVPKVARVVDETGTLSAPQRAALAQRLADFERTHGSQVAVLIVPSTGTEPIEDFATRVTDAWRLGRKGVDDGVLFVIAKDAHTMRIHTGRGVQGTLTDALSKRIVSDLVAPYFRRGDFPGGIDAGVGAIMQAIEGERLPLPAPASRAPPARAPTVSGFLWVAFFLVPIAGMVLRALLGRLVGAGATSALTGLAGWLVFGSIVFGVLAAVIAFAFTVGASAGGRRGVRHGGWGAGPWIGGGGFGGGGGGFSGGGGGFSGGGGSFDGGGASGRW